MVRRYSSLVARLGDVSGQTYVEYALILVAIASIVLAGWSNIATAINAAIGGVVTALGV